MADNTFAKGKRGKPRTRREQLRHQVATWDKRKIKAEVLRLNVHWQGLATDNELREALVDALLAEAPR